MEPISFALAIIAEARTLGISIKNRIENYRKGPGTFETLRANVDRLDRHIDEVERLLETFPSAVPSEISTTFYERSRPCVTLSRAQTYPWKDPS